MKVIQFKRKNSQNNTSSPDLKAGELFVFPSEEKIRIGKNEDTATHAAGTYFEIKSKLNLGDTVYNASNVSSGYQLGQTFVGVSGSGTSFNLVRMNGQQVPLNVTISSTAEYAKKLVTSGTSGYTEGADTTDAIEPIWFSGGIPKEFTKSSGSASKPVYVNEGKIQPISSISLSGYYLTNKSTWGKILQANASTGQIQAATSYPPLEIAGESKNISYTNDQGPLLSSIGITKAGLYVMFYSTGGCQYTHFINLTNVSTSGQVQVSTTCRIYNSSNNQDNYIRIEIINGRLYIKRSGTSVGNVTTGTFYWWRF